jgi:hypothetical protein
LLQNTDYTYIEPGNIKTVSGEINPTNSRAENVIDHVWVKQSILAKYTLSTEIYDGFGEETNYLYGGISDHKPVILTIQKKKLNSKTEKLNSKTKRRRFI